MPAAAITFFISLALLVGFVFFRFGEEKRGVKLWARTRDSYDATIADAYKQAVMGNLPSNWRVAFLSLMHKVSHAAVVLTVQALRAIERPLLRLSYRMRRGVPSANGKEPSEFLKTISEKKDSGTTPDGGV